MSNRIPYHNPQYPYSRPPNTLPRRDLDPIAAIARAVADGRELTPAQKELVMQLTLLGLTTPSEE